MAQENKNEPLLSKEKGNSDASLEKKCDSMIKEIHRKEFMRIQVSTVN